MLLSCWICEVINGLEMQLGVGDQQGVLTWKLASFSMTKIACAVVSAPTPSMAAGSPGIATPASVQATLGYDRKHAAAAVCYGAHRFEITTLAAE